MSSFAETARSWTESRPVEILKGLLEAAFFRNPEPQPVSTWRMVVDPPMPYWVTVFSQTCRVISLLILLPIFLVGVLDFAGYAVFRTLGLHRRRVRIQRQSKAGVKVPVGRSSSRRKPRIYQNDRHRPTDRSNIPSIVKAPLLSPGTYDAETLLRQRARSLSIASAEEEAAWIASGGQQARLSIASINKDSDGDHRREPYSLTSPDSDGGGSLETDGHVAQPDYFGRAPRVGVDGALGMTDTDIDESGTESGRESPVQQRLGNNPRRGLSGGLNFTPVSADRATPTSPKSQAPDKDAVEPKQNTDSYNASVVSLSSDSPSSCSQNGERLASGSNDGKHSKSVSSNEDAASSNMSSSWIGIEPMDPHTGIAPAAPVDAAVAAAAAGLEAHSRFWSDKAMP
ncbi:uncharacterized protein UHOD_05684 [Ustilago sp. UG-2017b]|nr:uncharacterized protein UHOD_05684 [Ustilago sp. UG-2017b]